ncbi:hypothetical protein [Trueperella sp.]|uniref:hypothetical protein n=1 Tax=Trueperella sp. TaxID=2699835 RepID=UPI003735E280
MADEDTKEGSVTTIAKSFLRGVTRIKGAHVSRESFLRSELRGRDYSTEVEAALASSPEEAGVPASVLDEIANDVIDSETKRASAISFGTGIPGGFAILASVPADITQFYVHAYRIMQKLSYLYGWPSTEKYDDEDVIQQIAQFLGVMLDVKGAQSSLNGFVQTLAMPASERSSQTGIRARVSQARTAREVFKKVGSQVARRNVARQVTKVVPIIGGVVSGGLTFVTLKSQAKRLKEALQEMPAPKLAA